MKLYTCASIHFTLFIFAVVARAETTSSASDETCQDSDKTKQLRVKRVAVAGEDFPGVPRDNVAQAEELATRSSSVGTWQDIKLGNDVANVDGYPKAMVRGMTRQVQRVYSITHKLTSRLCASTGGDRRSCTDCKVQRMAAC